MSHEPLAVVNCGSPQVEVSGLPDLRFDGILFGAKFQIWITSLVHSMASENRSVSCTRDVDKSHTNTTRIGIEGRSIRVWVTIRCRATLVSTLRAVVTGSRLIITVIGILDSVLLRSELVSYN